MHEESLVRGLFQQVDRLVEKNCGVTAREINVEIGTLSGVEPELLFSAFKRLVGQSAFPAASLNVTVSLLTACCEDCGSESEVRDFRFVCPQCEGRRLHVISGDSVRLLSVVLELPEPENSGVI
ncbi:MAG: hydrogenase maturation nickel metallochaperone HypA [Planctomyces sp.]|nr:hydrogenase maturation nickel metallochaperone HypA [Planctomyces sp.]